LVCGPEARGIGCQSLVNQKQFALKNAELKFRVSDDDTAFARVLARGGVQAQARVSRFLCNIGYPGEGGARPRDPRFDFSEACRVE